MTVKYKELFVNTSFGDPETQLDYACQNLCRRGYVVDYVTEYLGPFGDVAGYKVGAHTED